MAHGPPNLAGAAGVCGTPVTHTHTDLIPNIPLPAFIELLFNSAPINKQATDLQLAIALATVDWEEAVC